MEIASRKADLYKVGFGAPAQNDQIVRDAELALAAIFDQIEDDLGPVTRGIDDLALVNGPASLPVAVVIANSLLQRYGVVAVFDPKMSGYVVSASSSPAMPVGMVIPA
ncbi:hypothetical protein A3C19_03465 [Candidatus Kaiserbacteria bacterium RIFCSPHIGHO2_02_FULL_54_22]|uniref:CRISPR system ring nuclease SSO1393-like domain-containing protein n=1 Tax=Candidatus Kaiserbacteria bacterium RIFCSPHIGHO2_02_FULL_54_22 TaxID=1798495 RepID=A0A1F6DMT4_9BACT|nr:MAG: hypothetical protein A3C19_03465 [Candidatus Kaiserbacteria bacterium RIFCSPHIGHO2_02_FULL_54_22]OGG68850.1 MAG: hypothetical protein A3E99_02875 [Candidatus Kaiserbacteria bacterium RIFCSPHIGHO2_12_FULL_54_16]OGG90176.1 MAG: hypothetical protein A3G12_03175 [Candidatus Kaiserbacteria bacterium RIFCSPLOWO2_12_FULL_54_10]